jgi:hypothetical protein
MLALADSGYVDLPGPHLKQQKEYQLISKMYNSFQFSLLTNCVYDTYLEQDLFPHTLYRERSLAPDKSNLLLKIFCSTIKHETYLKKIQLVIKAKLN